jgi:prolipoprotein diacylglyceryl transferase
MLNYIIWSPDPVAFEIPLSFLGFPDRPVVWYGILFALGFVLSQQIVYWIWERDGKPRKDVDTLTTHMVVATILGARLGHCLFYNPSFYLSNPIEILKIWEGGLASHGGALGILIAIWVYVNYDIKVKWFLVIPFSWKIKKQKREGQNYLWVLDRLVIVVALTGAMIRTGNFMNSEMEGKPVNGSFGVVYAHGTEELLMYDPEEVSSVSFEEGGLLESDQPGYVPLTAVVDYARGYNADTPANKQFIEGRLAAGLRSYREVEEHINFGPDNAPLKYDLEQKDGRYYLKIYGIGTVRHTAQLYEAAYCLIIMIVLFLVWYYKREDVPTGFNFALFNIMLWSLRFVDEFFKMNQEAFEENMALNMGQWLSIPMFLMGIAVMVYIYRRNETAQ